jgi:hypothetical protein
VSSYLRKITFVTEFDGDTVMLTMRPIERGDALRSTSFVNSEKAEQTQYFIELFEKYVDEISGLVDASGASIEKSIIMRDLYFTELIVRTAIELVKGSSPKNPKKPDETVAAPSADSTAVAAPSPGSDSISGSLSTGDVHA